MQHRATQGHSQLGAQFYRWGVETGGPVGHCLYWVLGGSMESKPRDDGNRRLGVKEKRREEGELESSSWVC